MWVPLIENGEHNQPGADYFVEKHLYHLLSRHLTIDTLLLACTHYPLLLPKIRAFLPDQVRVISQGPIVANRLADYLYRHPDLAAQCSQQGTCRFLTTDSAATFGQQASLFWGQPVVAEKVIIDG